MKPLKLLAPILVLLLVITSGVASAQPRNIPREDLEQQMEPAGPVGINWMEIWVSYWWLIVIGLGLAIGSGLAFVFTRGLIG